MTTIDTPRPTRKAHLGLFRYSGWDIVPAVAVILQLALLAGLFFAWPQLSWPARLLGGVLWALSIGWSLDSVAHNFIHNPFFVSKRLNRLTAYMLTIALGTPMTMYHYVHMRHHAGNSDRRGADGTTVDPISLYQFGADDKVEPMLRYVFMQWWRDDDPFTVAKKIGAKRPDEARQAMREFWVMVGVYLIALAIHWDAVLFLAPFYYLGQCFSFLIAWYEHAGADPDSEIANGVSTYEPIYNWLFLNNGYHAEHHHRPKLHWTQMERLRRETQGEQAAAGLRTMKLAHFLGFLEPSTWSIPRAAARKAAKPVETPVAV